jgi:hypothetical protein
MLVSLGQIMVPAYSGPLFLCDGEEILSVFVAVTCTCERRLSLPRTWNTDTDIFVLI